MLILHHLGWSFYWHKTSPPIESSPWVIRRSKLPILAGRSRLKFGFNIHWRMKMWRTQFDCMLMNEDQTLPNLLKTKVAFWKVLKTENMKSPVKKTKTTPCAGSPNFDLVHIRPIALIVQMFCVNRGHKFKFEFYYYYYYYYYFIYTDMLASLTRFSLAAHLWMYSSMLTYPGIDIPT